jgi:hypothetical protein
MTGYVILTLKRYYKDAIASSRRFPLMVGHARCDRLVHEFIHGTHRAARRLAGEERLGQLGVPLL